MKKVKILHFFGDIYIKNKVKCTCCLVIMLLITGFSIVLPKILQYIIDGATNNQEFHKLLLLSGGYIGVSLVNVFLIIQKEILVVNIKKSTLIRFKVLLLNKISQLSGKELTKYRTGELFNLVENDTELLEACGIDIIFDTLSNVFTAAMSVSILIYMQWDMLIIVLILQMAIIWSQLEFTHILTVKTKKIRQGQGNIYNVIQEFLANAMLVITNKAKNCFFSKLVKCERKFLKECAKLDIIYVAFNELGVLFSAIITVFMYTYGGYKIIHNKMTIGELIAFVQYTGLFLNPCISVLKSNTSVQKLKVSIGRIYEFLEQPVYIKQNNKGIGIEKPIKNIRFNKVTFSYGEKNILEEVDFELNCGNVYAFVGKTGCGKSTLINLLFRWWDVRNGEVLVNDINIKEYNLLSLRKNFSIATQNAYILDDTVERNITLGKTNNLKLYKDICEKTGVTEIIKKMKKGDQTIVGENGNILSGGQKQRIILARTLLQSKSVIILDEVTSALDNITQNSIVKNVKSLYKDKIVVIITHRLDTIRDVDTIFVMDKGRICEKGNHDQLMGQKGYYFSLVSDKNREEI